MEFNLWKSICTKHMDYHIKKWYFSHLWCYCLCYCAQSEKNVVSNWIAYACTLCVLNSAVTECGKLLVCAREEGCRVPACMVKHVNECQKIFHNSAHTLEQQFSLINAIGMWERPCVITSGSCLGIDPLYHSLSRALMSEAPLLFWSSSSKLLIPSLTLLLSLTL